MTQAEDWRRTLGLLLSRQGKATVEDILRDVTCEAGNAQRIAITGPPGAGKSTLICALAGERLGMGRRVSVLAIDPSSPISHGALLGDRIRMDEIATHPQLFIRSISSDYSQDGLCRNILGMLETLEGAGFEDVILETVGVGQINCEARKIVDTLVLVITAASGDTIQAMKAGVLEIADIYVVNKADLPGSERIAAELRAVAQWRRKKEGTVAPVVSLSAEGRYGARELSEAIDAHHASVRSSRQGAAALRARREYQLRALIMQRLEEIVSQSGGEFPSDDMARSYAYLVERMRVRSGQS